MEEKIIGLIQDKGPCTGSELIEVLRGPPLALWKACCLSPRLHVQILGSRYLRLDRKVEGLARLSPSILREFMTYTVVGLKGHAEAVRERTEAITRHILALSRAKHALAVRIIENIRLCLDGQWPRESRMCFIIAGDIVYDMAHDVPRPEQSTGKLVNGSDIDLVVVSDDGVPGDFLESLDGAIHKEKYYTLIAPSLREEIDYVVKDMKRVREQLLFDTFKRMVACKILQEGVLLSGSSSLFHEIKGMLVSRGITARLEEMTAKAERLRDGSREHLLGADPSSISRDDLNLFYTTEESEEFE